MALRTLALSFLFVLSASGAALAAEGAPANWPDLLWRTVTIVLVLGLIWKLAGQKMLAFFADRRSGIERELHDLEERKEQARAKLAAVEKRIASLESERQAILADYAARGEALQAEIVAKAEQAAARIADQAKQTARHEIDRAAAAMRAELAEQITDAARDALVRKLSPKEHEKLIDSFLTKVVLQ